MLPDHIFGSWVTAFATLSELKTTLDEYIECSFEQEHRSRLRSINWIERTMFTFGDSDWAKTEGSLIFENRRAVLYGSHPVNPQQSHVIFLAVFLSSLVNLQQSVTDLMAKSERSIRAVELDLAQAWNNFSEESKTGAEFSNSKNNRFLVRDPKLVSPDAPGWLLENLHLRLGESQSPIVITRNGQVTFLDPNLSLDEVTQVASEVIEKVPLKNEDDGLVAGMNWDRPTGGTLVR